jgi:hypothetical protein
LLVACLDPSLFIVDCVGITYLSDLLSRRRFGLALALALALARRHAHGRHDGFTCFFTP